MHKLTTQLIKEICDRIRAGAFEQLAVLSLGITLETYQKWLDIKGRGKNSLHQQLRDEVMKARAHARLMAEMQLRSKEPKAWLLNGPGKQTAELPGWSSPVKAGSIREGKAIEQGISLEMMVLFGKILEVLAPFPEARLAVAEALGHESH